MATEAEKLTRYDGFRDYLFVVAGGYVPTHEVAHAYALATEDLQARLAEAERLLTELTADGLNFNPGFWQAVKDARAFLKGGTNG